MFEIQTNTKNSNSSNNPKKMKISYVCRSAIVSQFSIKTMPQIIPLLGNNHFNNIEIFMEYHFKITKLPKKQQKTYIHASR